MTTQTEARAALIKAFDSGFEDVRGARAIPVAYDNLTFEGSAHRIWIEVAIRHTASTQETLGNPGNRRYRREGELMATIHSQTGVGAKEALDIAEGIRKIFEGRRIKGINPVGGVLVQEEGKDITGFLVVVIFPFWYEERG